ncbi:hypothetical protein D3C79_836990 [compost metagenome]
MPPQARAQRPARNAPVQFGHLAFLGQQGSAITGTHQALDRVVVVQLDPRLRIQPGGSEPLCGHPRQLGAAVIENQRSLPQPGRCNPGRRLPVGRHVGQDRVAPPGGDLDALARHLRQSHQADIQGAFAQPQQGSLGGQHLHLHIDAWMCHPQVLQCLGQQVGDGAGRGAQAHPTGQAFDLAPHFIQG